MSLSMLAGGITWADQADDQRVLRFCVCTNAMPRAGKNAEGTLEGVDVAVAKELARVLGRSCEFHACASDQCRLQNL
ncbi:MAG: hypothetical protein GXP28_05515, partial [Planctomycetes bacterium]|nr:hypothetical protein [Planctomycetota bacterium]